ncbi:cytochrome P450 3A9 [Pyrenophora seminiperda CCB06]|uniref:Cytochrome P450 3A9 n=1 Tax=Pyrenophora seminiperda CCB06 TaxID=1302712 RepID=A0A3M7MD68_9PLEO|nr:cytochrome P450 3A9 [Pyrenophora seminiperda CCB06]
MKKQTLFLAYHRSPRVESGGQSQQTRLGSNYFALTLLTFCFSISTLTPPNPRQAIMANYMEYRASYDLSNELENDCASNNCFVLNVGCDKNGDCVTSSAALVAEAIRLTKSNINETLLKLYIVGEWTSTFSKGKGRASEENDEYLEKEYHEAGEEISKLIEKMPALKELTWISGLPFMPIVWEKLSTSLTKLVLDLGQPIKVHHDVQHDRVVEYNSYITANEMKPLVQQTRLKELRLFRMQDSMQSSVWEAIFRNVTENGMRVVDLQMAAAPLVRSKHWLKADDVAGLTVLKGGSKEKDYKGIEGKGVLHYCFGTGEYLDDFCMRKARIAAGLDEAIPLPLRCLKLDGFVVDWLPFERELSRIVLLTCGPNCIDSGLRAPEEHYNKWNKDLNNAMSMSHCLIQWPNWFGGFDEKMSFSPVPLTQETLQMKDLNDALDSASTKKDYSLAFSASMVVGLPSVASTHGSEFPTSVGEQATLGSPKMTDIDRSSGCGAILALVDSANTVLSAVSNDSSFEEVTTRDVDGVSDVATHASNSKVADEEIGLKTGSFKQKVRRSLEWWSGSGFSVAS